MTDAELMQLHDAYMPCVCTCEAGHVDMAYRVSPEGHYLCSLRDCRAPLKEIRAWGWRDVSATPSLSERDRRADSDDSAER